jgi:hypothetical protein
MCKKQRIFPMVLNLQTWQDFLPAPAGFPANPAGFPATIFGDLQKTKKKDNEKK